MSITSLYLDAFVACARQRNFTRAATLLNITQSALSQRIASLESELGTALLIRDRTGVRPTPAGETLLRYGIAREALESETLRAIKPAKRGAELGGTIRIAAFSSVLRSVILPSLEKLVADHARIKLQVMSRELSEIPALLRSGAVDYVIVTDPIVLEGIASVPIGVERNVLIERRNYSGPDIFLDHDENDPTTIAWCKLARRSTRIERRFLDDVYGLIDGVRLGWGRAVVPEHLIVGDSEIQVTETKTVLQVPVHLQFFEQPYYTKLHDVLFNAITSGARRILG